MNRSFCALFAFIALLPAVFSQVPSQSLNSSSAGSAGNGASQGRSARVAINRLPLTFEPNRGQAPPQIAYVAHAGQLTAEFRRDRVGLVLPRSKRDMNRITIQFPGARTSPAIAGEDQLEGHVSYLLGNDASAWIRNISTYRRVRYTGIYPGIDLLFYGNGENLEHDFMVAPGGDPSRIAFRIGEAKHVRLQNDGALTIDLPSGRLKLEKLHAYQGIGGVDRDIPVRFELARNGTVHFRVGEYDPGKPLIIDPALTFATYLDTTGDEVYGVATDAAGNTYVTGATGSSSFPATSTAFQTKCPSCANSEVAIFVTKLNAAGTAQIYSTYLGGSSYNQPSGIAVDGNGNAIVTGYTWSSDFPTKNPVGTVSSGNNYYGFITSFTADGSALNYSSLLGDSLTYSNAVTVDAAGNAYITGITDSPNFPVTSGALHNISPQYPQNVVFITKFTPSGTLGYSAFIGDSEPQNGGGGLIGSEAIAVDSQGSAYITGGGGTLYPTTSGSYLPQLPSDAYRGVFVSKLHPDGSKLDYSTFLGLGGGLAIALDSTQNAWVSGTADDSAFPITSGAYSTGYTSQFFAKVSADGSSLDYSSFFPASITQLAVDRNQNLWLSGSTGSTAFPLINPLVGILPANPYAPNNGESSFLTEFNPSVTTIEFSTYMGDLSGGGVHFVQDTAGKLHVAGTTVAPIYTTPGAFLSTVPAPPPDTQETYPYVAVVDPNKSGATLCIQGTPQISFGYQPVNTTASQTLTLENCGNADLTVQSVAASNSVFTITPAGNTCTEALNPKGTCTVAVAFDPTAVSSYSGMLTVTSNASIPTSSIPVSGIGAAPSASFALSPSFAPLLVGQTSPPSVAILQNSGQAPLTINTAQTTITGDFALASGGTCGQTLGPSQNCSYAITFTPTAAGTRTGVFTISTSDPNHPTLSLNLTGTAYSSYPAPTVTYVVNPTYPVNSGTVQSVQVIGTNFFPASVISINGIPQKTTYQGNTYLTFTLDTSVLSFTSTTPLTVTNPSPGGGTSAPYPITGYYSVPISATALAYDSVGSKLYAAIGSGASSNPNTVIPIDPATGSTGTPISVAAGPNRLVTSGDGSYLYVGSATSLQRINLKTQAVERTFALPDSEFGQTTIQDMQVVPGSPQSVVTALAWTASPSEAGAAMFNDSGMVNYLGGNVSSAYPSVDTITFAGSPSQVYGLWTNVTILTIQISQSGLSYSTGGAISSPNPPSGSILRSDGTNLYTNNGQIWSPSTLNLLGAFLEANGSALFYTQSVLPSSTDGRTYFLDGDAGYYEYQSLNIDAFSNSDFSLKGSLAFPGLYSPDAADLIRWGTDGFAFRIEDTIGANPGHDQIVIVHSDLPGVGSSAPLPVLTSISPSSVNQGSPAASVQLTGTGFTAASVVQVNGSARSTSYVSATELTASLPASDFATAGTLKITVYTPTPGGGTSAVVNLTVVASSPAAQLSASSLSFGSVVQGSSSTAQTVTLSNTGGAPLAITSITASGDYAAKNTCGSSLAPAVQCSISVTFTPTASGQRTGALTVTDNAAGSPQSVSLSGTGVAPVTIGAAQGGSTSTTVASGATATYSLSLTGASGFSGTVALTCTGAPEYAQCNVTPGSVSVQSGASSPFTVTVSTSTQSAAVRHNAILVLAGTSLLALFTVPFAMKRRRRLLLPLAVLIAAAGLAALNGCGGGGGNGGGSGPTQENTPPGTYTLTITATAGSVTESQNLTLVVQ